jgi:hypothetical protein
VFWQHSSRTLPSVCVTVIACVTLAFWILHTKYKWANFLKKVIQHSLLALSFSLILPIDRVTNKIYPIDCRYVQIVPFIDIDILIQRILFPSHHISAVRLLL